MIPSARALPFKGHQHKPKCCVHLALRLFWLKDSFSLSVLTFPKVYLGPLVLVSLRFMVKPTGRHSLAMILVEIGAPEKLPCHLKEPQGMKLLVVQKLRSHSESPG